MAAPSANAYTALPESKFQTHAAAITPSNATLFSVPTRFIRVGGTGVLAVKMASDSRTPKEFTADWGLDDESLISPAHGLVNGQRVALFSSGTLPTGLVATTAYFVVLAAANQFSVALTLGGLAVTFSSNGTGVHQVAEIDVLFAAVPAARQLPFRVTKVFQAGTTATNIVATW